jgi:hypothetical protein
MRTQRQHSSRPHNADQAKAIEEAREQARAALQASMDTRQ